MMGASAAPWLWVGCMLLVVMGAAVQVAVGAGLSVIRGAAHVLWLGAAAGVPTLLDHMFA